MALRRLSVALEHSVTVRERVLARDFSFNMGGVKYLHVCKTVKLPGRVLHSEKEGQRDKQKMSQRRRCDGYLTVCSLFLPGLETNDELEEEVACSLDKGREDKMNLNCSHNDQQW